MRKVPKDYEPLRKTRKCLCCGKLIEWGRTDKMFCSMECKDKYHNKIKVESRNYRNVVNKHLLSNYQILDKAIRKNKRSLSLSDAVTMGFNNGFVTLCSKNGRHIEYGCYDISFRLSDTRIFNIQRMSLNLRVKKSSR